AFDSGVHSPQSSSSTNSYVSIPAASHRTRAAASSPSAVAGAGEVVLVVAAGSAVVEVVDPTSTAAGPQAPANTARTQAKERTRMGLGRGEVTRGSRIGRGQVSRRARVIPSEIGRTTASSSGW